jgi:uncharacterized membrane protein
MFSDFKINILLLSALMTALMAGLFYNWTTAITVGLAKLPDKEYIVAFQAINRAIQNPFFFLSFFGAAILLPICAYLYFQKPLTPQLNCILAATICYWLGVMCVTIFGNVPLNNMLDLFDLNNASPLDITNKRLAFENKWNNLNTIRTISSIASLILLLLACLFQVKKN